VGCSDHVLAGAGVRVVSAAHLTFPDLLPQRVLSGWSHKPGSGRAASTEALAVYELPWCDLSLPVSRSVRVASLVVIPAFRAAITASADGLGSKTSHERSRPPALRRASPKASNHSPGATRKARSSRNGAPTDLEVLLTGGVRPENRDRANIVRRSAEPVAQVQKQRRRT
jgi:hypothetical protein